MEPRWKIPEAYKKIYSLGLCGKHIDAENEKYVVQLRFHITCPTGQELIGEPWRPFTLLSSTLKACESNVLALRNIFSTLNEKTYKEYFHHLLWFEETKERQCVQNLTVERVKLVAVKSPRFQLKKFDIMVPKLEQKQRYIDKDNPLLLVSILDSIKIFAEICAMDIKQNKLTIRICSKTKNSSRINVKEEYKLVFLYPYYRQLNYLAMHETVDNILSCVHKTKIFPKKNIKCNKNSSIIIWFNPEIAKNHEQKTAVEHIVAKTSSPAPYILHGPPGTGKTATVVETILQVLRLNPASKILVCAPSNSAADDVATKLIKYESLLPINPGYIFLWRRNSSRRDWSTLPKCLDKYSKDPFKRKLYISYTDQIISVLKNTHIVVSTISHAMHAVKELRIYTHLFIDEAAQATEPSCLVAIRQLLVPDGLLVISGDPLQLGPVLNSQVAKERGLGTSLMERLMKDPLYDKLDPNYTVMLKNNFRSHEEILRIPNKHFYNGQLKACAGKEAVSRRNILNNSNQCHAISFYAVFGKEAKEKGSSSYFNEEELKMLKFFIKQLVSGKHKERGENIGIITPYTAQVVKIRNWLNRQGQEKIEVGSVESYQGREKKIILMSTVRGEGRDTTTKMKLGFLADFKRFNVALTRAKAKLIVIGNPISLETDTLWRIYIETCKEIGSYYKISLKDSIRKREELQTLTSNLRKMQIN